MLPRPAVLDSWMEPSVVRKREITNANGDKETMVEPLIMERHERVMLPYAEESTTERRTRGPAMISHQSYYNEQSSFKRPAHRHFIAHKRTPMVAHAVSHKRFIARNTTTTTIPSQVEIQHKVVEKSVVIDRKDPALNIY
jgi:hypothetical protein